METEEQSAPQFAITVNRGYAGARPGIADVWRPNQIRLESTPPLCHSVQCCFSTTPNDLDSFLVGSSPENGKLHPTRMVYNRDYAIGIGFIIIITLLWTFGNFVTQVSGSSSRTVGRHLSCDNRTYMEVATINRSCMPESFMLYIFSQVKISGSAI